MFLNKSKVFLSLTKARLSFSVVFSTLAGYVLAVELVNFSDLVLLLIGGYCMVGASNSFNQIIEKDKDALMDRTKSRPLPTKKISTSNAFWIIFQKKIKNKTNNHQECPIIDHIRFRNFNACKKQS